MLEEASNNREMVLKTTFNWGIKDQNSFISSELGHQLRGTSLTQEPPQRLGGPIPKESWSALKSPEKNKINKMVYWTSLEDMPHSQRFYRRKPELKFKFFYLSSTLTKDPTDWNKSRKKHIKENSIFWSLEEIWQQRGIKCQINWRAWAVVIHNFLNKSQR